MILIDWNHHNKHCPNNNTYNLNTHIQLSEKVEMKIWNENWKRKIRTFEI